MSTSETRRRGQAFEGQGYGTQRRILFEKARDHINKSISDGYFCEAISIIESIISDRLESRLSYLDKKNVGFWTLGKLIVSLLKLETDPELKEIIQQVDKWREKRNKALHEMVKVEADKPALTWEDRIIILRESAIEGYQLTKSLYNRVADLNPRHHDRVFPRS